MRQDPRRKKEKERLAQLSAHKAAKGEALSPPVKAELRWVTQGSGPHSAHSGLKRKA